MTSASAPTSLSPIPEGHVLAEKYRVQRVLGVGGMGVVVAAQHLHLGYPVAIKFVRGEIATDEEVVARFLREAQASTRITTEHVARVSDVGTLPDGSPYLVMEYLVGSDLGAFLDKHGAFSVPEAVDIVLQALVAVAEAHGHGIVHRDLKPSNLFITKRSDGTQLVKVLDFGIATAASDADRGAITRTAGMIGSPAYSSPEQIRSSRNVDARSDMWSLGVVLFELLTKQLPFYGDNPTAQLAAVLTDPVTLPRSLRPDLPEALEGVIMRCLTRDRKLRMGSAAELATSLAPFASREGSLYVERVLGVSRTSQNLIAIDPEQGSRSAPTVGTWSEGERTHRFRPKSRRIPYLVAAGSVLVGLAVVVIVLATHRTTAPHGESSAATSSASAADASAQQPVDASANAPPSPVPSTIPAPPADSSKTATATKKTTATTTSAPPPKSTPTATAKKPPDVRTLIDDRR